MNLKSAVGSHEEAQKRTKKEHTNLNQITCMVNENSSSGFLYVFVSFGAFSWPFFQLN
jgi:hypothetical protein